MARTADSFSKTLAGAFFLVAVGTGSVFIGCKEEESGPTTLSREELLDPNTCGNCHVDHFKQWSGSMHAYAAKDPLFLAMNARLQKETNGALGPFCVNCHAPMAVIEQPDTDWIKADVDKLPDHLKGVTCYFCHNAIGSDGDRRVACENGVTVPDGTAWTPPLQTIHPR